MKQYSITKYYNPGVLLLFFTLCCRFELNCETLIHTQRRLSSCLTHTTKTTNMLLFGCCPVWAKYDNLLSFFESEDTFQESVSQTFQNIVGVVGLNL